MLRQVEILKAVQDKLKKIYPLKVYLDEVKEDFETPCFFLKLIKTAIPHNIESNKCLNDCLLIIAKSVSRFARNTVDSLSTIRKLKDVGCECYFEKKDFRTQKEPRIRNFSALYFFFGV